MDFDKRKTATLSSINTPPQDYTDKSPKGTLDLPILPLLNAINSHPSFFTTSSCSGRISILSTPTATATTKKKARGGNWVLISHDPVEPTSVLDLLYNPSSLISSDPQELVFRFEPLIIAVECRDVISAQSLVSIAISCGFRESGITSVSKRVIVAVRCSIRLEVPLGDSCNLMVSPDYVRFLVGIANEKMEVNRRRTDQFFAALLSNGFGGPENGVNVGDDDGLECGEAGRTESCLGSLSESPPEGNYGQTRQQNENKWKSPHTGQLKFNVDASVFSGSNSFSIDMILRDNTSSFIKGKTMNFSGSVSIFEAEAVGMYEAMVEARTCAEYPIIIETDPLLVVQALQTCRRYQLEVGSTLEACQDILLSRNNLRVSHVKKLANRTAYLVARLYA